MLSERMGKSVGYSTVGSSDIGCNIGQDAK